MAVVVEPILTEEKLLELLAEGHEQSSLDYKRVIDLNNRRDTIELAKDVAAMQAEELGGYIVIGADDYGVVVADVTTALAALFDEAKLRAKLKKYIAEPFDVRAARHEVGGNTVVLLYIAPHPEAWCIFVADGEYEDPPGKRVVRFRVGDVFVRRGTASERWQDADRKRLMRQVVARLKESWRAELRADIAAMNVNLGAKQLEQMPVSAFTWKLDASGFEDLATELIRREDDVALLRMLSRTMSDAAELVTGDFDELTTLLDRVAALAALSLTYEEWRYFERSSDILVRVYEFGVDVHGLSRRDFDAPRLWLQIAARIYGLGGLAVRMRAWGAVRYLANRKPVGQDFEYYRNWLRHAQVMASRARILDDKDNPGLIARAHNVVRSVAALRPDVMRDSEAVLASLCQFDALASLVVIGEGKKIDSGSYYPNFARYYSHRTEPAFALLVNDKRARKELFDGDDTLLASAIQEMNRMAQHEGFSYDGWGDIVDQSVRQFLQNHIGQS